MTKDDGRVTIRPSAMCGRPNEMDVIAEGGRFYVYKYKIPFPKTEKGIFYVDK
jgi:hypothetical protein